MLERLAWMVAKRRAVTPIEHSLIPLRQPDDSPHNNTMLVATQPDRDQLITDEEVLIDQGLSPGVISRLNSEQIASLRRKVDHQNGVSTDDRLKEWYQYHWSRVVNADTDTRSIISAIPLLSTSTVYNERILSSVSSLMESLIVADEGIWSAVRKLIRNPVSESARRRDDSRALKRRMIWMDFLLYEFPRMIHSSVSLSDTDSHRGSVTLTSNGEYLGSVQQRAYLMYCALMSESSLIQLVELVNGMEVRRNQSSMISPVNSHSSVEWTELIPYIVNSEVPVLWLLQYQDRQSEHGWNVHQLLLNDDESDDQPDPESRETIEGEK